MNFGLLLVVSMDNWFSLALVAAGAFMAGGVNAIAGGGTFFSFPALLAAGVPPVIANASNAVALWPASIAGAAAFRHELGKYRKHLVPLSVMAFAGGVAGGVLLLNTQEATFTTLIPWLLLLATLLFAFSASLSRVVKKLARNAEAGPSLGKGGLLVQGLVSIYGGFFGAGMGILMLASLAIQGIEDVNELNALKNWLSAIIYSVASITFIWAGSVDWPYTVLMIVAASLGGYAGAFVAKSLPAHWVRKAIVVVGLILSALYFGKVYF